MKIAFDCLGTLKGPKEKYVLMLLLELQKRGHSITVWSNGPGYPQEAVERHGLKNVETSSKYGKGDYQAENGTFDYAIEDDRSQTWLAAKRFIWVDKIPGAMGGVMEVIKEMEFAHNILDDGD